MFHRLVLACFIWSMAALSTYGATIFSTNSSWKYFKGRTEASTPTSAWRQINFDDSTWLGPSNAWFYYGDPFTGTLLNDMMNQYSCVFLRKTFVISNLSEVAALRIGSYCDDGFMAWINGTNVQRYNFNSPPEPIFTSLATGGPPFEPPPLVNFDVFPVDFLVQGTNVIAVQLFNITTNSSDIAFNMELKSFAPDTVPPTISAKAPAPGTVTNLTQITVTFSEPVSGVDPGDLFINGNAVATLVSSGNTNFVFRFPQPPYGPVQIGWEPNHNIKDLGFPGNFFDHTAPGATWQYNLVDLIPPAVTELFPPDGVVVRALSQIEVTFSEEVTGVDASDLRINGQGATNVMRVPGGPYIFRFPEPAQGTVQVQWAAGHGITDFAATPNPFAGGSFSYQLDANATGGDLIINEFVASNQNGIRDENGEQNDWIEIYNRGSNSVNLAGWALSDDPDLPGLWTFPARLLAPGQYLVVFASAKNRKSSTGTNHTNFRLGGAGEHLGLYSPDSPRLLVSGFNPYPEQRNDHSYGYDSGGDLRYFATPTPRAPNGDSSIVDIAQPVHFSAARGHYTTAFDLYLSTPTGGADIRYTTDGSEPTASTGFVYTGPLRLTNTVLIRAAAFRPNFLPSTVTTHSYLFNLPAAIRSLPVISLVTATNNWVGPNGIIGMSGTTQTTDFDVANTNAPGSYHNPTKHGILWERPVSFEYIKQDNTGFQQDCGIRVQGSDYRRPRTYINQNFLNVGLKSATPNKDSKFSFRLYFRGDYGAGTLDYPLFTNSHMHSHNQLVLRGGMNDMDNPFIRDEWTRRIAKDAGQVTPHGNHAIVFINGLYYTNSPYYNPTERVHEEMLQSYHGGTEEWDVISPSFAQSSEGAGVVDGDRNAFESLRSYANANNPSTPTVYLELSRRLDLVNFIDYNLVNIYTVMGDWPQNNFRMGKDRGPGGIFRCYTWDAEWACDIYGGRPVTYDIVAAGGGGPADSGLSTACEIGDLYRRLTNSFEFRLLFADRTHKHMFNGGALMDQNLTNRFYELREELREVLPSMQLTIAQNWVPTRRTNMFNLLNRYGLLASSNAPVFSQHGGRVARGFNVTMTNMDGTIYYTTNGADPRVMFTGAVSNAATAYSAPVVLNQTTVLKARSRNAGGAWSALTEATFEVASLGVPLRVTEIMYNPIGGTPYEFIELQNVGPTPLDISGFSLDNAITFTFLTPTILPAGGFIVVANNTDPVAFTNRYGAIPLAGFFGGNLGNGGERILVKDPGGNVILSVDYDDNDGWPLEADGAGYSLEIIDAQGDPDSPSNWRASTSVNGSAGSHSQPPPLGTVRLNEVMAENLSAVPNGSTFPDWIELVNASASPVDLTGWSLSDEFGPRRFIFPSGTMLPANGFLVIWCDSATNEPGLHTGFGLGRLGDTVALYNTSTTRVDIVSFGPQVADLSIGRINLADPWRLTTPTPLAANVAAGLGGATNVVINEWLANPIPGQPDWVELYNRSTSPVALQGFYVTVNNAIYQLNALSFIGAQRYVQLFASEQPGADQLDMRLPGSGATVTLYDDAANQIDRITYGTQTEGVSQGRLPDGSATIVSFPNSVSGGASNYVISYTGPYVNEVLTRNRSAVTNGNGQTADFVELFNPGASSFNLGGMSMSFDEIDPGQWRIPANTMIGPGAYLTIWCDASRPPSTNGTGPLNSGRALDGDSGGVYLFNALGQIVSSVEYGPQVENLSIGRVGVLWRLLSNPTPGAANAVSATLTSASGLRVNEWMALPLAGPDWFEIYNPAASPVDLNTIYLTDDPSSPGIAKFRPAPLSFIGAGSFTRFVADGDGSQGRHHVNFSLDAQGESIRISGTASNVIHTVHFGSQQGGVSEGLLPDGSATTTSFPGSATPGESNYRLIGNAVINEVLSHGTPKGVELYNPSSSAANIGGWFLSDTPRNYRKYRIADGTTIPGGGFLVIPETQFNDGSSNSFALNAAYGGEVILSAADSGNLTGERSVFKYGAAASDISFGPVVTSVGTDIAPLRNPTLGSINSPAKVGPVVISEIMYHPLAWVDSLPDADGEYVELHNTSASDVLLFDPAHPTNTWRLGNGIEFEFAPNTTLLAGRRILLVNFNPSTNVAALAQFRGQYGLGPTVTILGPYRGKLSNGGEQIEMYQPGTPEPNGYVPQILVELVNFSDSEPWPSGAVDGGGLSLQRRSLSGYANEPLNWLAGPPTPAAANSPGIVTLPAITTQPQDQSADADQIVTFSVAASGGQPLSYQWRRNGVPIEDATNATLVLRYVQLEDAADYDVLVSNPAGSILSRSARLSLRIPPVIVGPPQHQILRPGNDAIFRVTARGAPPLSYQWLRNGVPIPGANGTTLGVNNVQPAQTNEPINYTVEVTNADGMDSATASLIVLVNPVFTQDPRSQTVAVGDHVNLSTTISNTCTLPLTYRWRKAGGFLPDPPVTFSYTDYLSFPAVLTNGAIYGILVTNAAGQTTLKLVYVTVVQRAPDRTVSPGENTTLPATVAVAGTLRYQWLFNGTLIPGATTTNLVLTNVQPSQAGVYTLMVTNITVGASNVTAGFDTILSVTEQDTDSDGMPDSWEDAHGLQSGINDASGDPDMDGKSNLQEYISGTDPQDDQSVLQVEQITAGGAVTLEFTAIGGKTYTVEYSDDLATWAKLLNIAVRPTNRVEVVTDPAPPPSRYYRLVTPRQ